MFKIKLYDFLTYMLLGVGVASFALNKLAMGNFFIMPPCFLCTVEQALLVIAGIAALYKRVCVARFTLLITGIMALYHTGLQMKLINSAPSMCNAAFDLDADGVQVQRRSSCSDSKARLFGLPMPLYVVIISFASMGLFGYAKRCAGVSCELDNRRKKNNT